MRFLIYISVVALASLQGSFAFADWNFDFSRRTGNARSQELKPVESRAPASTSEGAPVTSAADPGQMLQALFNSGETAQEIVILNTERGFVPNTIRVRKGLKYVIHVVNVNEKEKNISFILDAFSESHSTFYGKIKTFELEPKKEGIYSFQSPETGIEGKVVVLAPITATGVRSPASESR